MTDITIMEKAFYRMMNVQIGLLERELLLGEQRNTDEENEALFRLILADEIEKFAKEKLDEETTL